MVMGKLVGLSFVRLGGLGDLALTITGASADPWKGERTMDGWWLERGREKRERDEGLVGQTDNRSPFFPPSGALL